MSAQDDLDAIRAARRSGALEVQFGDNPRVRYRSDAEMARIEAELAAEVTTASGTAPASRIDYAGFTRGVR